MNTLHDAFIKELKKLYYAEKQISKVLPILAKAATDIDLKAALEEHRQQTLEQIERLDKISKSLGEKLNTSTNGTIKSLIDEGSEVIGKDGKSAVKDAAILASTQKVEHYEIASYGTAAAWAKVMEHDEEADLLAKTLEEEKKVDEKLSKLAEGGIIQSGINELAVENEAV